MKRLLILSSLFVLSGCASHLSQRDCQTTNWFNMGEMDSIAGRMPRNLSASIQDCAKFQMSVDTRGYQAGWQQGARRYCAPTFDTGYLAGQAGLPQGAVNDRFPICQFAGIALSAGHYQAGWQKGIKTYCSHENGMNLARQGLSLPEVCPPQWQARFAAGWREGQAQFCNQPANAFALGREGKAYPAICPGNLFAAFRYDYDRGAELRRGIDDQQQKINALNNEITDKAFKYSLHKNALDEYELGSDHSPDAANALNRVNELHRQEMLLKNQLLQLRVTH